MEGKKENYILVLFGTNFVSYNIASSLYGTHYKTACLFPKDYPIPFRWSRKFGIAKQSYFELEDPAYVGELIAFVKGLKKTSPILTFLTNDLSIWFWVKHARALSTYCSVLPENVNAFSHKQVFFERVKNLSVPYPKTWELSQVNRQHMPFIAKAAFKDFQDNFQKIFSSNVAVINQESRLEKLRKLKADEIICQEILDFEQGDEYSWNGYRDPEGKIFSVVARHKRKYPDKFGRITHLELVENSRVKEKGDLIVNGLNYFGIGSIQFIRDRRDGEYKVIDFNPRFWCSHEILLMNGIDLIQRCADDFYRSNVNPAFLGLSQILEKTVLKEWFSVLDNLFFFNLFRIRCTECYLLKDDNFITKIIVSFFLVVKMVYYFLKFKLGALSASLSYRGGHLVCPSRPQGATGESPKG